MFTLNKSNGPLQQATMNSKAMHDGKAMTINLRIFISTHLHPGAPPISAIDLQKMITKFLKCSLNRLHTKGS